MGCSVGYNRPTKGKSLMAGEGLEMCQGLSPMIQNSPRIRSMSHKSDTDHLSCIWGASKWDLLRGTVSIRGVSHGYEVLHPSPPPPTGLGGWNASIMSHPPRPSPRWPPLHVILRVSPSIKADMPLWTISARQISLFQILPTSHWPSHVTTPEVPVEPGQGR